jgi:hypothetical protein
MQHVVSRVLRRRPVLFVVAMSLTWMASASVSTADSPTLLSVGQQNRHATAAFIAPGADDVAIYFATRPDRATDGRFLEENVQHLDVLTRDEIQAGRWLDSDQLDPGSYHVMLRADDYDCFGEPACMEGFSNMLSLTLPKPAARYRGSVRVYRYLSTVALRFKVTPLGERQRYRVCWRLVSKRRRCVSGAASGYSWNEPGDDVIDVRKRGMPRRTTFTWYVDGRRVASKRVPIPRR